ncbi:MAG TPA: hypothetical protein VNJ53_13340 [Gaiellaceae bacterium]|nr:hypothetical protein [Gaiellaceae bacterium]
MRPFRAAALVLTGALAGFAVSGALLRRAFPSRGDETSDELELVSVFAGTALRSRAQAFRGGSVLSWCGGTALDLREATLAPGARLTVYTVLGGVALRVPPGWRVRSSVHALAGGVAVNVPEPEDPEAPTLVVDGLAVLGGVAVGSSAPEASA